MSILGAIGGVLGGLFSGSQAKKAAAAERAFQMDVAQNQIQWKVADAKKAGIHPLAAMGHQMVLPSPQSINTPDYSAMGQNVGRAIDATAAAPQKEDDYTRTVQALNIERMGLENNLIKTNLVNSAARTVNQAGNAPTFLAAQGESVGTDPLSNNPKDDLKLFGYDFKRNPNFSDGENFEKRYQDLGNAPAALVALGDIYQALKDSYAKPVFDITRQRHNRRKAIQLQLDRRRDRTDHGYF